MATIAISTIFNYYAPSAHHATAHTPQDYAGTELFAGWIATQGRLFNREELNDEYYDYISLAKIPSCQTLHQILLHARLRVKAFGIKRGFWKP